MQESTGIIDPPINDHLREERAEEAPVPAKLGKKIWDTRKKPVERRSVIAVYREVAVNMHNEGMDIRRIGTVYAYMGDDGTRLRKALAPYCDMDGNPLPGITLERKGLEVRHPTKGWRTGR